MQFLIGFIVGISIPLFALLLEMVCQKRGMTASQLIEEKLSQATGKRGYVIEAKPEKIERFEEKIRQNEEEGKDTLLNDIYES